MYPVVNNSHAFYSVDVGLYAFRALACSASFDRFAGLMGEM